MVSTHVKWQIFPNSEWKTHNCWKQTPGCVWHVVSLLLFILFTLGYLDTPRSISSPSLIADEHRHILYIYIYLGFASSNKKSMVNNQQPSGQLFENTREECCLWFQRINSPSHKPWEANFSTMTYSKAPTKRLAVATTQVVPFSITLLLSLFLKSACYMRR